MAIRRRTSPRLSEHGHPALPPGLPGDEVSFAAPPLEKIDDGKGRLLIDGRLVDEPPPFQELRYQSLVDGSQIVRPAPPENEYAPVRGPIVRFTRCTVPPGRALPLGDNTDHSYDGRYWGSIPLANIKGKAFLRYWPLRDIGFLE
ncbi:MAG: signal peptidase I [Candidatus Sumerlaeota bacterium]|nr:signal peptidase I [Candidatus Sumerlaeota bacterium]